MFLNRNGSDIIKLQTKQMNVNVKTIISNLIYFVLVMVEIITLPSAEMMVLRSY